MASKIIVDQLEKSGLTALTLPVANATANQHLKNDGAGALSWVTPSAAPLFSSYALIADEKTTTTDGGTFTSGAWQTRDLQTEIADPDGIVSIATNAFTLAAGSYFIEWQAPAYRAQSHKSRLYDVTGTAVVQVGSTVYADTGYVQTNSTGYSRVAPSGSNVYRIEHQSSATVATQGFGLATGFSEVEIYTIVRIFKEA